MLDNPSGGSVQIDSTDIICVVKITTLDEKGRRITIDSVTVRYVSFLNGGFNQWITIDKEYELRNSGLEASKNQLPSVWVDGDTRKLSATFVEYCVYWYGVQGCTLYVDKIITYDERGYRIKLNDIERGKVSTAATAYKASDHMLGWYGMEEPKFIDNYEPYRVVDSLIRVATNNTQFLHTSITVGEKGKYWYGTAGSQGLSPLIEFAKRAKPHSIHLNSYHYDYPYPPDTPYYHQKNIEYVKRNLDSMTVLYRDYELDFSHAVFGGDGFYYDEEGNQSHVLKRPSKEQLLYTTNLGLLYGAKQIWIDPAFSYYYGNNPSTPGAYGLLDINLSTTSTYNTFKDTIIPRLHGEFGRTLRKLRAVSQHNLTLS